MTLRELANEVNALCFDDYAKLDTPLLFAARRALTAIYGELRITGKTKLLVSSNIPCSKVARFHHTGGGTEVLPLSGKAYVMTVSGQGCVTVIDGASSLTIDFDSDSKTIKGFLSKGGKAVFKGSTSFDVYNIITYSEVFGNDIRDIPTDDGPKTINLREKIKDFGGFTSPITDSSGSVIQGAVIEDGAITLPMDFSGAVNITYRRLPYMPSLTDPDAELDIPEEYSVLLPLLLAFYILLDDEYEKAEIYKAAYTENLNSIKKGAYSLSGVGYADVNGWGK